MGLGEVFAGGGGVMGALGAIGEGNAKAAEANGQQAVAEYNARVAKQNATQTERATAYQQQRLAEEQARQQSTMLAGMGASGAVPSQGTPLLVQQTQAVQAEMDQIMTGYQGQVAAARLRNQASLDNLQASIYGKQASSARMAGYVKAGSSLLKGFGGLGGSGT